jgi:uncharacterized repeat protein (TIGR03803 family)
MRITAQRVAGVVSGLAVLFLFAQPAGAQPPEVVHTFSSGSDGAQPQAAVIQADDQNMYGTTRLGGGGQACPSGCGTVFKMAPDGTGYTVLHAFTGGSDGAYPAASLVQASDGNLYGTTQLGGSGLCSDISDFGCGTVFRMAKDGTGYTVVHTFFGSDGALPVAALIEPKDDSGQSSTAPPPSAATIFTAPLPVAALYSPSRWTACGTRSFTDSSASSAKEGIQ